MLGRWTMARRDDGSTQIFMLLGMIAAIFLTVLAVQVAQANDMRSRAVSAADATAIAAVTPLRDRAIELAQMGVDPAVIGLWEVAPDINADDPVYNQVARTYARRNDTDLTEKVHPSGANGHTMKASIRTDACVIKKDEELTAADREDLRRGRNVCTDASGRRGIAKHRGTATAIAELKVPPCEHTYAPQWVGDPPELIRMPVSMSCGGVTVWHADGGGVSREAILRVFKIRLVSKEDPVKYTGIPNYGTFGDYTGPLPDLGDIPACALVKQILANAYKKIGLPYVWGGESLAEGGFDCSGMIYASYLEAGVPIPRTTYTQFPFGVHVPAGSEKPGDLVFFNTGAGSGPGPGHVGLVLDPSRKLMIEAACTACGPIRISSYNRSNVAGYTRPLARFGKECKD